MPRILNNLNSIVFSELIKSSILILYYLILIENCTNLNMLENNVIKVERISYFLPTWSSFTFTRQLKPTSAPLKWFAGM